MDFKQLYEKYKDIIPYAFFGVCTTLVNIASYWVCAHPLRFGTMVSTVIAWILAVLFAYVTNRKWVFNSQAETVVEITKEIISLEYSQTSGHNLIYNNSGGQTIAAFQNCSSTSLGVKYPNEECGRFELYLSIYSKQER